MILSEAEARVALGLTGDITNAQRAVINSLLPKVDAAIIKELRYDPQYRAITDGEYYPANSGSSGRGGGEMGEGYYEVAGSVARWTTYDGCDILQLRTIPVRSIEEIRVDNNGGFGQKDGTFGTSTIVAQGSDWWMDKVRDYFNATGHVFRQSSWPIIPGSILVKYTAGYTQWELSGRADSGTDPETNRAASRINASGIKMAAELTIVKAFKTFVANAKQGRAGFTPGPLTSERLGGYSYSAGGVGEMIAGMKIDLTPEAKWHLGPFVHYGIDVT